MDGRASPVFSVSDILQIVHKGGAYHTFGTGYQYTQYRFLLRIIQNNVDPLGMSESSGTITLLLMVTVLPMRTLFPTFA